LTIFSRLCDKIQKKEQAEMTLNNIKYLFMVKMLKKLITQGMYFNIIKAIYNKPTANTILCKGKQSFCSNICKTRIPTFNTFLNIVVEVLAKATM
jgi:hypothetical protein